MAELLLLVLLFFLSLLLIHLNFELAIKVFLVLSVFLHKEVFSIYQWDYLPVRLFMLALAFYFGFKTVFWLVAKRNKNELSTFLKNPFFVLLIAIWLVRLLSLFFSKNLQASILLMGFFTTIIFLGIVMYKTYYKHSDKLLELIKLYIYIVFGLCVFGYFQLVLYLKTNFIIGALWNVPGHTPRIGSTFWDVNHFGALLAVLLPVFGGLILVDKSSKNKLINASIFLIMVSILVLTSSRTSWIIAFVAFVVFVAIHLIKRFGYKGIAGLFLVFLLIAIPALVEYSDKASPFRAVVKQNFHYRLDSFASHIMLITGSYQIFEQYPLLGGGYGSFFEHFRKTPISATFFGRDPAALNTRVPPHTIWGEVISETGLLGLIVFVPFIVLLLAPLLYSAFRNADRSVSIIASAMFSALVGIFIAGIFYSYNSEFFWLVLFLYFIFGVSTLPETRSLTDIFSNILNSPKLWKAVVMFTAAFLLFVNLGGTHLIPWDEAIYAKIAKNMTQSGDYIDMVWQPNKDWFEKPPLGMWLQAGMMNLLGYGSLAVRFPSAFLGFLTVLLVYKFANKLFGHISAFVASLSLVTTIHFLQYARYSMLDVSMAFFITLGMYFYYFAQTKKAYVLAGISFGLGVMTKGVVGLLPFGALGIFELLNIVISEKNMLRRKVINFLYVFGSAFAVFMPWHILMYMKHTTAFVNSYLIYHVFDRAREAIEDKGQPWHWYFVVLKVSMRLWFIALLGALPISLSRAFKKDKANMFLLCWVIVTFAFFSWAKSKVVWYIVPIYPPLSILIGGFAMTIYNFLKVKYNEQFIRPLILYLVLVVSLGYFFSIKNMVYTSDLTGSKAKLLMLKDKEFTKEDNVYIHGIEEPLILYYTDGSFSGYDLEFKKGRIPLVAYDQKLVLLAKKGRYPGEDFILNGKKTYLVGEDGDFALWYYKSGFELDSERLAELEKQIAKTAQENTLVLSSLIAEKIEIENRMAPFMQ